MTEPTKGNEHILANHEEFQQTYARAREYFKNFDGVAGVGFGLKETGGKFSDDISIIVYVYAKKKAEDVPPDQQIPATFEGYRTDVAVVEEAKDMGCENTAEYPTIQGAISIGISSGEGTLGCIVKQRNNSGRENVYLLTCKHVLYDEDHGANDVVYHPFHPDNGTNHALGPTQPGAIKGNVQRTEGGLPVDYYVDAAIARIDLDSKCCGSTCTHDTTHVDNNGAVVGLGLNTDRIADVRDVMHDATIIYTAANPRRVYKAGRTTRRTVGRVTRINHNFIAARDHSIPNSLPIAASNVIEIELDPDPAQNPGGLNCQGNLYFADDGDSGSVVVDEAGKAIGVVTSTNAISNRSSASHILAVLDALQISVVCAGTSHGSVNATDGSGVAVAAETGSELADGQIAFTHDAVAGPFGLPAPPPVSAEEQRYMTGLLERLRRTRRGRALHDLFGRVRREVGYLVRNHKLVKVAWHRYRGPAFLALTLDHIKGNAECVPREVDGVSVVTLLTRMAEVLTAYGSNPLREAIETHRDEIARLLADERMHTVDDCLAYLEASGGEV